VVSFAIFGCRKNKNKGLLLMIEWVMLNNYSVMLNSFQHLNYRSEMN
jgi:hypothetical protein